MSPRHSPLITRVISLALGLLLASCGGGGSGGSEGGGGYSPPPPGGGGGPSPIVASTYVRSFGSRQNDESFSLAALSDGGLAISGSMGENNWVGVLDATGFPVSELRIGTRDEFEGIDFETSRVVEGQGAVFAGTVIREQTGTDVVVRFRRANGETGWEQVLDAGRWSGDATLEDARIVDRDPHLYPVIDDFGVWQGVWVVARSEANVVGANSNGDRHVQPRSSATLWFIGTDGAIASRTRLIYVAAPAEGNVYLDSAAVLDTGSLAVMLREFGGESFPSRRVVRRIGRDGTIGGPFIEIANGLGSQLRTAGSTLLLVGTANVARLDISAQTVDWTATLSGFNTTLLPDVRATRVVRGSTAELVLGMATADVSRMARFNLFSGAPIGACELPAGLKLLSLRGRDSGNLRALLANSVGTLSTVNLDDDCAPIAASETILGASLPDMGDFSGGERGAELSAAGDYVHEFNAYRARRRITAAGVAFDLLHEENLELTSLVTVVADASGQMGIVGTEGLQRRNSAGVLQRTDIMRGIARAASDDAGRLWATGGYDRLDTNYCAGLKVLQIDGRAECRTVEGYDLNRWSVSKGPGNGVWVWDDSANESLHFGSDGSVVAYPTNCGFDQMDVGPDGTRVGVQEAWGVIICRQGMDGRGWQVELDLHTLSDNLAIDESGDISAVAASDGGVAVLLTVRQHGAITGLRSNANITGDADLALLKLDADGNPQWLRVYGAARDEYGYDIARMADGGYALLGQSNSLDALTPGSVDIMVVRTGPDGHVARTVDGGDACQACLGSITGQDLREVVSHAVSFTSAASVPRVVTTSALTSARGEGTTTSAVGETNARQCTGNVTNVQESAVTEPPPTGTGEGPTARFVVSALYGGATANPIANRDPAHFNAQTSTPVAALTRYQWDFEDDGTFDAEGYVQQNNYGTRGTKTVRLRVTDSSGRTNETTQTITVDAAPGYYLRVLPVHDDNLPGNGIEGAGGSINCRNGADGSVAGACFATRSNSAETTLTAVPGTGSAFSQWIGCDSTRTQTEGPPLCVINGDLDGRERLVEARFVAVARATVTVVMTGASAAQGRVFSHDNALNCPTICTADYAVGSVVELHATWGADGDFVRFESCDVEVDGVCFLTLGISGRSVMAVYR